VWNELIEALLEKTNKQKKNIGSYIPPIIYQKDCVFTKNTHIGKNCSFNGIKIVGTGFVEIGDNFHCGKECLLITASHNYDKGTKLPYDSNDITGFIDIEDNVWFGHRVIVLPDVTIGEGAVVQAGSVVVSDVPKCAVVGGSPAKVFKYRDIKHYEDLKKRKAFLN